ncbi:MAG: hypothetical protein QOF68_1866, partial [Gaiellales bacterium]|nr:hypothetical protein [Gaiellales bacterium]
LGTASTGAALKRVASLVARGTLPGSVASDVAEEIGRILDSDITCVVR